MKVRCNSCMSVFDESMIDWTEDDKCPCCKERGCLMDVPEEEFPQYYNHAPNDSKVRGYKLEDCDQFCKEAFTYPPFEEGKNMNEWFSEHKIHITVNGCDMELEYDADAISILECALKELHGAIFYDKK